MVRNVLEYIYITTLSSNSFLVNVRISVSFSDFITNFLFAMVEAYADIILPASKVA